MSDAMHAADLPPLSCWKDIARYLGKGVRTVQRWEREFGLPVRRPNSTLLDSRKAPVAADPGDLQEWLRLRWGLRAARQGGDAVPNEDQAIPLQLRYRVQRSRELQAMLKSARQAHHTAVQDITATVISLTQSCQHFGKYSGVAMAAKQSSRGLECQKAGGYRPPAVNLTVQANADPNRAAFSQTMHR